MYKAIYTIPKESRTQADSLLAEGFAEIIRTILAYAHQPTKGLTIADKGAWYQITLPDGQPLQPEWVQNFPTEYNFIPFLANAKEIAPDNFPHQDIRYPDKEWEDFKAYQQAMAALKSTDLEKQAVDSEAKLALSQMRPKPDFWTVAFISDFRMQGLGTYNNLIGQWWATRHQRAKVWELLLQLFTEPTGNHEEAIIKAWAKPMKEVKVDFAITVTASQLFNPHTGKGQNRPKADVLVMGNEKSFWLKEYIKAIGLFHSASPRVVQGGGFRKTYALSPKSIEVIRHREIFRRFDDSFWGETAIKMDITATLRYVIAFLEYTEVAEASWGIEFEDKTPNDYVQGFYVATYQQLSKNAYTMMNLAFIGLPEWARVSEAMERYRLQEIIGEHLNRIRSLDESQNAGYNLLLTYRDFICANEWDKLFDFLISYGAFVLSQLEQAHYYIKPFSETNIRRLFMTQKEYAKILENEGFCNVAKAIRLSTITPQYIGRKESLYEVRYGLGQTFKRSSHYTEDFITALMDFMHSYNEENGMKQERHGKQFRENLTEQDVKDVIQLIDEYSNNPQLICNLLLAYGYAKDVTEKGEK